MLSPITREAILSRIYIRSEDVADEKYGLTSGCKGCEAANRGSTGIHNEHCRKRIELEILQKERHRYNKVLVKLSSPDVEIENSDLDKSRVQEATPPEIKRARAQEEQIYQEGGSSGSETQQDHQDTEMGGEEQRTPKAKPNEKREREKKKENHERAKQ